MSLEKLRKSTHVIRVEILHLFARLNFRIDIFDPAFSVKKNPSRPHVVSMQIEAVERGLIGGSVLANVHTKLVLLVFHLNVPQGVPVAIDDVDGLLDHFAVFGIDPGRLIDPNHDGLVDIREEVRKGFFVVSRGKGDRGEKNGEHCNERFHGCRSGLWQTRFCFLVNARFLLENKIFFCLGQIKGKPTTRRGKSFEWVGLFDCLLGS